MTSYTCVTCRQERTVEANLNGRQRRAVCVCEQCMRDTLNPRELHELLNPKEAKA